MLSFRSLGNAFAPPLKITRTSIFQLFNYLLIRVVFCIFTRMIEKEKIATEQRTENVLEFRRRYSTLGSNGQVNSSIILRPKYFQTIFSTISTSNLQDFNQMSSKKINVCCLHQTTAYFLKQDVENDPQKQFIRQDSCLTPAIASEAILVIEELSSIISNYYLTCIGRCQRIGRRNLSSILTSSFSVA